MVLQLKHADRQTDTSVHLVFILQRRMITQYSELTPNNKARIAPYTRYRNELRSNVGQTTNYSHKDCSRFSSVSPELL
jgi:uncharacterized membrane protein (UPF0127 family)